LIRNDKEGADINQTHLGIDGIYRFSCSEKGETAARRIRKIERLSSEINGKPPEAED
jgi:hypothetical protein